MINVAIITRSYAPNIGGVETFAMQLHSALVRENFRVRIITQALADASNIGEVETTIRIRGFSGYLASRRSEEIKVFVGVWFWPLIFELMNRREVILTQHNAYRAKFGWRVFAGVVKREISRAFLNVFVSQSLKEEIGGKGAVLPNSYDAGYRVASRRESYDLSSGLRLIYVGRLVTDKGVDIAVAAAAELIRTRIASQLVVVGDGPCRAELEQQATALCDSGEIFFTGWRNQASVRELLVHADLLLVPSKWKEPFGIVVLEALASGCGVVASNRGGLPEACGRAGVVVEPTKAAFVAAVEQFSVTPDYIIDRRQRDVEKHLDKHSPLRFGKRYSRIIRFVAQRSAK